MMNKTNRISLIAVLAALTSAGLYAQQPTGTPAGSSATGTTNSGGIAPATGGVTTPPTGRPDGSGTGTTPPTPTIGGPTAPTTTTTTGGNTTTTPSGKSSGKGPNENASEVAKAVHVVIADFQKQRDEYLAKRRELLDSLKTASESEKKAILEQLRKDNQERQDAERSLGKQIREELKGLREARKSGGT